MPRNHNDRKHTPSRMCENLTPARYRRTQFVPLQQLKEILLTVPADNMYDYQHTWSQVSDRNRSIISSGFDFARDLLSEDDFREVQLRRYHDLYHLAVELEIPMESTTEAHIEEADGTVKPTFSGISKGVEAVLQRLKIIEMEIKDLKQEIQGLRYYEHRLLVELHRKVNYLVNFSVQLEERKSPHIYVLLCPDRKLHIWRLVTNLVSGMTALRLHFLCEYRREMHVIEDQTGLELLKVDNTAIRCLVPYMSKFMKLLTFALKIGAQLATGMGHMIPDLSREVTHLADSSFTYGAVAVGAGLLGVAAVGSRDREKSRDVRQDLRGANQWLVDFLKSHNCMNGKDIAEKFGLWRVRYKDDGMTAWICKWHLQSRANEIIEVPI